MKEFITGKIRIQLLSRDIIRLELRGKDGFCDDDTYFVPHRDFAGCDGDARVADGMLVVAVGELSIAVPENAQSLKGARLTRGDDAWSYRRKRNVGELPLPSKTPFVFEVTDCPRITLPDGGYRRGAEYKIDERANDVYLLVCDRDCKKLRRLYVELTGRPELVRLATLGLWNSRYFAHSDASAREMIDEYARRDVPLDNMVLDTDWRKASDRGIGYEVDDALFPDMRTFFDYAHAHGVEIMFNDHPEPVDGARSALDGREIEYRADNLIVHLKNGLDYWWYDRNWHTKLISPSPAVNPESIGMYIFHDVTKQAFEALADGKPPRRPVIMANVDNVANGNYMGVNDTATHRYSVQWTGDVGSDGATLASEIKNLALGQNSCITYINSDCGGHTGNPTKREYVRWMQFGAFSPIFRPHCSNCVERFREPWAYDDETLDITREYVKMRYRLLPLLYKSAYESYACGAPLFAPLNYAYADDKRAKNVFDEYMLGNAVLVAPLCGVEPKKLTAANYAAPVSAVYYGGIECAGAPLWRTEYGTLDLYWHGDSPHETVPPYYFSAVFQTELIFDKDVELIVESDDGVTVYVDGEMTLEDKNFHGAAKMSAGMLKGGVPHKIKINYFQGEGEASIALYCNVADAKRSLDARSIYLPQGEWLDPFGGELYDGRRAHFASYPLGAMPLFVKRGSVIPLVDCKENTKLIDWGNVTLDYYPSKTEKYSDYIYEDDGETVAYKSGAYRISPFTAEYDAARRTYRLTLSRSTGGYAGVQKRRGAVKFHLLDGVGEIARVTVNGAPVMLQAIKRDIGAYPFSTGGGARDADVIIVGFEHGVNGETVIELAEK